MKSSPSETALPSELADAFARARDRLGPFGSRVLYFPATGSTNDVAAALASHEGSLGTVVIADAQTAGRGRRGHSWFSPPGSGVYMSVILAPGGGRVAPARATSLLTLTVGVALAEAIQTVTGLAPDIKWPNDLFVGRRKLGGILAEAIGQVAPRPVQDHLAAPVARPLQGREPRAPELPALHVVVGYGINVGPASYPPELADRATSLETELGRPIDRAALSVETLVALAARYVDLIEGRFDAILDAWRDRAPLHRGARVSLETAAGPQTGVTQGIDEQGALLVRVGDRVERVVAGAVIWL